MDADNDLENDLFEEYGDDNLQESTNEPQIEESVANIDANEAPTREVVPVPKRIVRNPRLKFNADRLCGERGIPILTKHFKNVKFKGKGHEKEDLNKLLSTLEQWSHRLFPSMKFEACLRQIEKLGKKRPVQTCLVKIRRDMPILNSDFVNDEEEDERQEMQNELEFEPPSQDAFDRLFSDSSEMQQPNFSSTPASARSSGIDLGTSYGGSLTEEQKKRIEYNKMLATERRKTRMASQKTPKENEDRSHSPSMIDSESASSTSLISAKPSMAGSLDDQFENLFGEIRGNESNHDDSRNNQCESIHGSFENHYKSISSKENKSEELVLDELMDLVDDGDSTNQLEDNGIPSIREASEKPVDQNLGLQFDSMFNKKDKKKSTSESSMNNSHKSILHSEDSEDESNLNFGINEYGSIHEDSKKNLSESIDDDSGKKLCQLYNGDTEKKLDESINEVPEENHIDSLHSTKDKSEELGLDELMDLVDE